jgi:hypothetical protein
MLTESSLSYCSYSCPFRYRHYHLSFHATPLQRHRRNIVWHVGDSGKQRMGYDALCVILARNEGTYILVGGSILSPNHTGTQDAATWCRH